MTRKIRILIADDCSMVKAVWQQFAKPEYIVTFAANGQEAIETNLQEIDIILMDVNMPVLSGIEATRAIRKAEEGARIPIIGVTAHIDPETIKQCLDAGMNEILAKPIFPDDVDSIIARWHHNSE